MGLFGFGKKKDNAQSKAPAVSSDELREIIHRNVAEEMVNIHIIETPSMLTDVGEDGGIYQFAFDRHLTEKRHLVVKNMGSDVYVEITQMHLMGAGMVAYRREVSFKKSAADFSVDEMKQVYKELDEGDMMGTGIRVLGGPDDGYDKWELRKVVSRAKKAYLDAVGNDWEKTENLNILMREMYNFGYLVGEKKWEERQKA